MVEPPVWAIGFFDDMPAGESVDTIHDASDLIRGVEAFLTAVPGASQVLCVAVLAHWVSRPDGFRTDWAVPDADPDAPSTPTTSGPSGDD